MRLFHAFLSVNMVLVLAMDFKESVDKNKYLENPCRNSSIPFWKISEISIPDNMLIIHEEEFDENLLENYDDERYFRLIHDFDGDKKPEKPTLPEGFYLGNASDHALVIQINSCYDDVVVDFSQVRQWKKRRVFCENLWLMVFIGHRLVASCISEIDRDIGEGAIEWLQVSPKYRKFGLGEFLIKETFFRMSGEVNFITVSGKADTLTNSQKLYRRCGFVGNDVYHVLTKKENG